MPHDKNGNILNVGDIVNIPCIVTAVQPGHEYCNLNVETIEAMIPNNQKSNWTLNTKQVEKVL